MLYVKNLSIEENQTLAAMHKDHPSPVSRLRAQAVLLSAAGFRLNALSEIFGVCRQTVSAWLKGWETGGICALLDKPRSGRPRKLTDTPKQDAIEWITQSPRSLKKSWHNSLKNGELQ